MICSLTTKSVVQPLMGDINHCFWSLCFIFVHGLNCLLRFMIFTDGIVCSTFGNFIHGLNCLLKFVIFSGGLNCLLNFWEFYSWAQSTKFCGLSDVAGHSASPCELFAQVWRFFIHGCGFYPWPQLFTQVCEFLLVASIVCSSL